MHGLYIQTIFYHLKEYIYIYIRLQIVQNTNSHTALEREL